MTSRYAENTTVSTSRSREEIERTLQRFGATGFMYGWNPQKQSLAFEIENRRIRYDVPMPPPNDRMFTHTATGYVRAKDAAKAEYDKETRRRWRAVALIVKAKLEAISSGISSLDDEFLPRYVLPSGATFGEEIKPQIDRALDAGALPPMLPGPTL